MKLNELTISEAIQGLHNKEFSVTELVSACLSAAEEKNKDLRAYLEIFPEALDEAKRADEMLKSKYGNIEISSGLPPLFGIPLALKDNILVGGRRCTAGSKILENYVASYDATVTKKIKSQGAIILGKTNLDEFAMGASTENSAFGPTKNPHDLSRVPGGSSGGSASAVAADLCLGALGSDTGGSIRQPSAFCGIVGLKPTYGAVSRHGLIAMASSLDQIGPMAKSVEDLGLLFDAIKGKDAFDATAVSIPDTKTEFNREDLKGIKIGVPKEYFAKGLDEGVEKVIRLALTKMEKAGAELVEIALPHTSYALAAYYIIVPSEVSANLARFDGIRYGYQHPADSLFETYSLSRKEALGPETKRRVMLGTYALSAGYYDAYYLKAQKVRRLIKEDFAKNFKKVDIIAGPTTPGPAFKIGEKTGDPLQMYLEDIYTVSLNLAGVPGLSLPAGTVLRDGQKLPIGLQLVAPWFEEEKLLNVAKITETLFK